MGCWNGTCAVSNLAIRENDPVRLIILKRWIGEFSGSGFCNSAGIWTPLVMPIRGLYNDYGSIKDYELPPFHEISFEQMRQRWSIDPDEAFRVERKSFKETLTWDGILEAISVRAARYCQQPLAFMLIHEKIWNDVIDASGILRQQSEEQLKEEIENLRENSNEFALTTNLTQRASWMFAGKYSNMLQFPSRMLVSLAQEQDPSSHLQAILDMLCFHEGMERLRKAFQPQTGAGSSHDERDLHRVLIRSISELLDDKDQRDREEL